MPLLKKKRLAGLWKKDVGGKTILEGNVSPQEILTALGDVGVRDVNGDTKITLTVWLNSEDEKRTAASPDASLVVSEKWKKPDTSTEDKTVKEQIPF
jgi:hypothetical protein